MTTNSNSGIEDYSVYYDVFKAMEEEGMVLNLHGEVPSDYTMVSCYQSFAQSCIGSSVHRFTKARKLNLSNMFE